ncbi:mannose-1-phosphate guanylyltransferase [Acidobacterium sp. S8]|uniref:mannose-1-phosphate guanylyltransferase n=1 Tax=Acidobacterium sp. S8 TaxID=1641854 RepID=UPI00131CCE6F|nr:mannose-1-phosphate guanylyltransferase [Acidobacterium sp. S8]
MPQSADFRPIILAGGSGTRFWPRSRRARAKQVLALDGERTMIQRTVDRLAPLAKRDDVWIITNDLLSPTICDQLDLVPKDHVVCEPAARNTAPAAGLAAFLIERINPDAVLGIFPSDHVIGDEAAFLAVLEDAIKIAAAGENMVVLGVTPTRAETGYGYIETGDTLDDGSMRVRRFTEKPNQERAEEFVTAGNYHWNSGIFVWSARTLADAIREHLSETAPILEEIAAAYGTPEFRSVFERLYPQCENISVDYAVLEPRSAKGEHRSNLYCLPANFGWNDLGSWAALYEHQMEQAQHVDQHENVAECAGSMAIDAEGNYIFSPGKFVALVGVKDLVVVETDDAILVTTRHHSQDVGKIVKQLAANGREELI